MSTLLPLLPQRSAPLNFHMCPLCPLFLKGQHHSIVHCPPPTFLPQRLAPLNARPLPPSPSKVSTTQLSDTRPLYPFSLKGQHHSTATCPPPLLLLFQSSALFNFHMPPSTPFFLRFQRHSTVICLPFFHFSLKGQRHSTFICAPSAPCSLKASTTQLSIVPLQPFSLKG